MDIAHYKCLSEADWLAVQQERLMLDMPIKMNWDALDNRMLTTFFRRYPDRKRSLYECVPLPPRCCCARRSAEALEPRSHRRLR